QTAVGPSSRFTNSTTKLPSLLICLLLLKKVSRPNKPKKELCFYKASTSWPLGHENSSPFGRALTVTSAHRKLPTEGIRARAVLLLTGEFCALFDKGLDCWEQNRQAWAYPNAGNTQDASR